jgi:hypothetical protein
MNSMKTLSLAFLVQVIGMTSIGCEPPSPIPQEVVGIRGIEFIAKKPDFGGEACVAMHLRNVGWKVDQDFVFDQSGLDPIEARGCNTSELVAAVKRIGIDPGEVWLPVDEANSAAMFAEQWKALKSDMESETPWVVCLQQEAKQQFVLVIGFDLAQSQVYFYDPGETEKRVVKMAVRDFRSRWILRDGDNRQFLVKLRMTKPRIAAPQIPKGFTDADYAQHIRKLKARMPEGDFKIVIQKPFVVIGDEDLDRVKSRSANTVGWAAKRLKEVYFTKDPTKILDVWLFRNKDSYERNTEELVGRKPTTPYGFYNSYHGALIMNISTGGGTLVHEIVHPFIESNFEECPSWFNEGFASLYEQCRDNDGKIWGSTNWRLRGLQLAIRDDRVPSFEELCSTTRDEFYDEDPGTNYAQARYLCYYLQQQGKLVEYYKTFRDNVERDPTGLESLKKVLERDDLGEFKKDWQKYVMDLRF